MKVNIYAAEAQRANPISNSNQSDSNGALVKKLIQLEPNYRSKFQEKLEKTAKSTTLDDLVRNSPIRSSHQLVLI